MMWQIIEPGLPRADGGVSTIEFAFIGSFLAFLMLAALDFGMVFFEQMQVSNAAQAGASYAASNAYDHDKIQTVAQNATNLSVTATPSTMLCGCPGSSGITSATCGSSCPGSNTGTATGYVKVQTSVSYRTIFPWFSSDPVTLSGIAYAICKNTTCT